MNVRTVLLVLEGQTAENRKSGADPGLPALSALAPGSVVSPVTPVLYGSRVAALGTLMTGTWPDQHGLLLAQGPVADAEGLTVIRRANAADRSRPAVWEMLDAHGVTCIAVGWPGSSGASLSAGSVVADAAFGLPSILPGKEADALVTGPAGIASALAECWMRPEELDVASLAELVPAWQQVEQSRDPRLALVAGAVAHNVSLHAAFLELLAGSQWGFATLCLPLAADLAHLEAGSAAGGDTLLSGLAERGQGLLDAFVSAILSALPEGVQVIIAGLCNAEAAGSGGSRPGFILLNGPDVLPGARISGVSPLDLAALVWWQYGFFAPWVPGRPLPEAFRQQREVTAFPVSWQRPAALPVPASAGNGAGRPGVAGIPDPAWLLRWEILALQLRAGSLMARGEWLAAMPLLEKQLALQPDAVGVLMQLVECQYFAGMHREALENAWDILELGDPEDPLPLLVVAGLEAVTGQFPKARQLLNQASPLVSRRPQARLFQGRVLIHLREWQEARTVLAGIVASEPGNAAALGQLARAHLGLGQWPEACEAALQATSIDLQDAATHEILGMALEKLGLKEQAEKAYRAAAQVRPSWPRPWARLVQLARQTGKEAAEVDSLVARYRQASAVAREREDAWRESVKKAVLEKQESLGAAASHPAPDFHSVARFQGDALAVAGMVAMSGTSMEMLREIAAAAGIPVAPETAGPALAAEFWKPLLEAPVHRADVPLVAGSVYFMTPAVPPRLPARHTCRLVAVSRDVVETGNDRKHLPAHLAGLEHGHLHGALLQERAGLYHLAEFSANLLLLEVDVSTFSAAPREWAGRIREFLRLPDAGGP